jgi:hypothetical protein
MIDDDECGAVGGMRIGKGNLPQCHFAHHKSRMIWPGLEAGPPPWEAGMTYTATNLRICCKFNYTNWGGGETGQSICLYTLSSAVKHALKCPEQDINFWGKFEISKAMVTLDRDSQKKNVTWATESTHLQ